MSQIVGHRWERRPDLRGYKCVGLPAGGVESGQWCLGCDCFIGDIDIYNSRFRDAFDDLIELKLDCIARDRGFNPMQRGSLDGDMFDYKRKQPPNKVTE